MKKASMSCSSESVGAFQEEVTGPLVEEFNDLYGRVLLPSHWMPKGGRGAPPPVA